MTAVQRRRRGPLRLEYRYQADAHFVRLPADQTVECPMTSIGAVRANHASIRPGSHPRTWGKPSTWHSLLGRTSQPTAVREDIAKRILEAAKAGERDPVRPARGRTSRR